MTFVRPWRAGMSVLLIKSALVAASGCGGNPDPSRLDAEVLRRDNVADVVQAYSRTLSARDWESFLQLFWPGATASAIRRPDAASDPQVVVSQVADRVSHLAPILSTKPVFESTLESPAVFVEDDMAMVWSPSATRIGEEADPSKILGVDALTLLRVGAEWRIISIAYQADAVQSPLQEGGSRQSILTTLERYYSDFSARNWTRFATHFWPDATIDAVRLPDGEEAARPVSMTVPEFVALVQDPLAREPIFEVRMGTAQVLVRGNLAQVWTHYRVRFGDLNVSQWGGVNAFTLIRFRGRWRVVSLAYNTDTAAAARYHF